MNFKRISLFIVLVLLVGIGVLVAKPSQNPQAIRDFMENSASSKPTLLVSLYNMGLIRNAVAMNTVIFFENTKSLLFRGMGLADEPQILSNPYVRYIKITEGLRKEEIAAKIGKALKWSEEEKDSFINAKPNSEGKLYPATYLIPDTVTPSTMRARMIMRFTDEILANKEKEEQSKINLDKAITIASIIQREAGGKSDMNLISGIIWNRIFRGMKLDMDATLQYAKGNEEIGWWPKVVPADKYIESPYNTYQIQGLPPSPISNPGKAAIEAASNPAKTKCLFYFHDRNRTIHCSVTYKEHVAKIKKFL